MGRKAHTSAGDEIQARSTSLRDSMRSKASRRYVGQPVSSDKVDHVEAPPADDIRLRDRMRNIASLLSGEAQTSETPSDSFSVTRRGVAVSSAPVVPPPPVPRGREGSSLDSDLSLS